MSINDTASPPARTTASADRTLDGYVHSPQGPLTDAAITLTEGTGTQVARSRSGDDGQFRLTGLRPGTYVAIISRDGYQPHADRVVLDASPAPPLNVTLEPAAEAEVTLAGTITTGGHTVGHLSLTLRDQHNRTVDTAVTDAHGVYRFDHLKPGTYTIHSEASAAATIPISPEATTADVSLS